MEGLFNGVTLRGKSVLFITMHPLNFQYFNWLHPDIFIFGLSVLELVLLRVLVYNIGAPSPLRTFVKPAYQLFVWVAKVVAVVVLRTKAVTKAVAVAVTP